MNWKPVSAPLTEESVRGLRVRDMVLISGTIYTARDRAHERLLAMHARGEALPVPTRGEILYYAGPSPTPPGKIVGSVGPTTSYRMDPFTEGMLELGIRGFIGKGKRSAAVRDLLVRYGAVYFSSFGGAAAYLASRVTAASLVAFEDLGPEAVYRYEVRDFPVIVTNDMYGGDLYEPSIQ